MFAYMFFKHIQKPLIIFSDLGICDTLDKLVHGQVHFQSDGKKTSVSFECDVGYSMSGSSKLECRADGSWDFDMPSCGTYIYCWNFLRVCFCGGFTRLYEVQMSYALL